MAQKRSTKTPTRKSKRVKSRKKSSSFNFGKFTLGLLILIILGYAGLAIWEGKLVIDEVSQFEMPEFFDEEGDEIKTTPNEREKSVPQAEKSRTKKDLSNYDNFNTSQFDLYFTKAFDFGWPEYNVNEAIIERPYYTIRYNETHEQAQWAATILRADSLKQKSVSTKGKFRKDPRIKSGSSTPSDFNNASYIMGQLVPPGDFAYSEFAQSQSYYMSNVSPFHPEMHTKLWIKLEGQVRNWAKGSQEVYVVTGPILANDLRSIGKSKVSVPRYFYKIVLDMKSPEIKAIAFLIPNSGNYKSLKNHAVSIDEIEQLTNLDFFPSMPDELEQYLESGYTNKFWDY